MRLLVSGCTKTTRRLMADRPDRLGVLLTPSNGNAEWWDDSVVWAADNDCFKGLDPAAYLRMLARITTFRTRPAWVACPDVVGRMYPTWEQYLTWSPMLRSLGLPVALVLQNGAEEMKCLYPIRSDLPTLGAVFVGGSTEWKLSDAAASLTLEAHKAGVLVHWGRVNTLRRIVYIARRMRDGECWCDTIDGTGFSAFGDKRIPTAIRWIDRALSDRQGVWWGGVA